MAADFDLDVDDAGRPFRAPPQRPGVRRAALGGLAAIGLLLLAVAVVALVQYRRLLADTAAESHTLEVLNSLDGLFSSALDAQNSRRGYVLTGDDSLVAVFDSSLERAAEDFAAVERLTSDNPLQVSRVAAIRPRLAELFGELRESMRHRRTASGFDDFQLAATRRGNELLEAMRTRVAEMVNEENRLLATRRASARTSSRSASAVLAVGALLALLLLGLLVAMVLREDRRRRRAEGSLRAGFGFLDEVINAMPVLLAIKDARDLRYVRLNRAGEAVLGLPAADFVGKTAADLFPRAQADAIEASDRDALASILPTDLLPTTISGRRGDRVLHSRKTAIRDAAGNPRYLLTVSEDVTDQVTSEQEITRLNSELESSLASALVANQELESFAYSVSHDLRAPLRAAHSFAVILRDEHGDALDSEGKRVLDVVVTNASAMGELIDDLLDFSRLSRQEMRREAVDVATLVGEVISELEVQRLVGSSRVTIGDLPRVLGDAGLLRRVFANLLSNALKYSRNSSPPMVDIAAIERADECVFTIRDNGVGFDMQYVGRLFTVFERLHSASEYEGTGVGLALVKRIVERHGGSVRADGALGRGATFTFTLPSVPPADA